MTTRHFIITGRVQGVGFRYATRQEAERLGLHGWVRNRADGRVEGMVQGAEESLKRFEQWLHQGPDGARVDDVCFERVTGMSDSEHTQGNESSQPVAGPRFQIRR